MTEEIKFGIIGTGRMARARAQALQQLENINIKWVSSRSGERGHKFAQKYDIGEVITDWKEGCHDPEVEALIITSPNSLHESMSVEALKNDKHVLLEYPMEVSEKKAENILKQSRQSSGKLHIGLTFRLGAKHQAVKKKLKDLGKIGTCISVMCSGNKISRWFDNKNKVGNVIIGSNFHFVDQLIDWFGEVEWVDADIYENLEEENENMIKKDIGSVMLGFKDEITAYVSYARGYGSPGLGFDRKIIGEKGYIVEDGEPEFWSPAGKEKIEYDQDKDSILEDTSMFVDYIRGEGSLAYTPEDGVYGVKVVAAASRSARKGERVYL